MPETIPMVSDRVRDNIRNEYMAAADHKALAISNGPIGFITGQPDDDSAKAAALDMCQQRADTAKPPRHCELYAVGTTVVYTRGHPPMPPTPWFKSDPRVERPLIGQDLPLLGERNKELIERTYMQGRKPKALALASSGGFSDYIGQDSTDEAARRSLEVCGGFAGIPCMILAVDDNFVVPAPTTMKAVSFFRPASAAMIAPELRDSVAHRLANAGGWTAVAVGDSGKVGLAVDAANEQTAIDGAMNDCSKQDHACHVIAIGPFAVEPK
jgi:adenylate cyclase